MDRRYELENLRRSLAMLTPGVSALSREQALHLVEQLAEVQDRLHKLRTGLQQLLDGDSNAGAKTPHADV